MSKCPYIKDKACDIAKCDEFHIRADERAKIIDLIDRHMWNYSKEVWEDFQSVLEQLKEQNMYTDERLIKLEVEEFLSSNPKLYGAIYNKALEEVKNALLEKADYMETEEGFYGKVVTEKEIEEVINSLR